MKAAAATILIKIVAYTLVALWFIKRYYYYVSKGHLWADIKIVFRREKSVSELSDEFIEYQEEAKGRDGEVCRVKTKKIRRLVSSVIPEREPDVNIYSRVEYRTKVNMGGGVSTKISMLKNELYPMPSVIYSILKKDKEFSELLSTGMMLVKDKSYEDDVVFARQLEYTDPERYDITPGATSLQSPDKSKTLYISESGNTRTVFEDNKLKVETRKDPRSDWEPSLLKFEPSPPVPVSTVIGLSAKGHHLVFNDGKNDRLELPFDPEDNIRPQLTTHKTME